MHHRSIRFAVLVLVVLAVSLVAGVGRAFAFGFAPRADFSTGAYPISVAVADFNGDDRQDLVVADLIASTASVLLGNGAGGFAAKTDFATGANPYAIAVGDLDRDGKPDLVTANNTANSVSVLLGNGDGSFAAKTDFVTGAGPAYAVAVGDLNNDDKLDVVTANQAANSVSVLLGNGDGSFAAKTDFATGGGPYSVAVGDVDTDGKLDVLTANNTANSVSVLLGNGDGSFAAKTDFVTGRAPCVVAVGDFNGDGALDLVASGWNSSTVSVLLGNGLGNFAAKTDFATGANPFSVTVGDLDGDGKLDVVTGNRLGNTVSVLVGYGDGSFAAKTDFATSLNPYSVALGDVNGDGRLDLATANFDANSISVLLYRPSPSGTMTIEAGAAYTTNSVVMIDNTVDRATWMRFRNEVGSWSAWEPYSATRSWSLTAGDGPKTVYAEYGDPPGNVLALSYSIGLDTAAPSGSFTVDEDTGFVGSRSVTLYPVATDAFEPIELQVRNAGASWPAGWLTLTTEVAWTLTLFEGEKTVEMRFRDPSGKVSDIASQAVVVETTPPIAWLTVADGAYAVNTHSVTVETWARDLNGGVVMRVRNGGEAWPGSWVSAGDTVPLNLPSGEGTKIVQAQFKDLAGNVTLVQDEVIVDTIDPEGSLSIAGGDPYTSDADVVLTLAASDATKVDAFKVRQDGGEWSAWQDMVEAQPLTLAGADGERTLEVQYRDIAGNTSALASDAIVLDRAAPTTTDNSDPATHRSFTLVLTPSDATSGVASTEYRLDGGAWISGTSLPLRPAIRHKRAGVSRGDHLIEYRSTDNAGNVETIESCTVKIG